MGIPQKDRQEKEEDQYQNLDVDHQMANRISGI